MKSGKLRNYSITDKTAESIYKQFVKEYKDFKIDYLFSSEVKDKLSDIIYRVVGHSSLTLIKTNLTNYIIRLFQIQFKKLFMMLLKKIGKVV